MDPVSGKAFGVVEVDDQRGEIVLRFARTWQGVGHPTSLVPELVVRTTELQASLLRIGQAIAADGLAEDGPFRAARDLLARRAPHVAGHLPGADASGRRPVGGGGRARARDAARPLVPRHPGSARAAARPGPGARLILDLVAQGRKVGVTANSHKVIGKVLDEVVDAARQDSALRRTAAAHRPEAGRGQGADLR